VGLCLCRHAHLQAGASHEMKHSTTASVFCLPHDLQQQLDDRRHLFKRMSRKIA